MITREEWLNKALSLISIHFANSGLCIPSSTRVSCGFPGGRAKKAIGQCWSLLCSADGATEIFISPVVDDVVSPQGVLSILVHEAVHAAVGVQHGHKSPFSKAAKAVGLEGKMTSTVAGAALLALIQTWSDALGAYPHAKLDPASAGKKQTTRMVKCECPSCGFVFRTTKKWIDAVNGVVYCPTGACGSYEVAGKEEDSDDAE